MAVTLDKPMTWTGTLLSFVVPLPSSPPWLSPQVQTVPSERNATPSLVPAETCTTPTRPGTCTGTSLYSDVPPSKLAPQAQTLPSEVSPTAKSLPAETCTTPLVSPLTAVQFGLWT